MQPFKISLLVLVGSFALYLGLLRVIKPTCITRYDEDGESRVSVGLLASFSLLFALVTSIAALVVTSHGRGIGTGRSMTFDESYYLKGPK
jgi:hypothetical protein